MKIGQCRGRNREKLGDIRLNFVGVNNQIVRVGLIHKDLDKQEERESSTCLSWRMDSLEVEMQR